MKYFFIKFKNSKGKTEEKPVFAESEEMARTEACLQFSCQIEDIISCIDKTT